MSALGPLGARPRYESDGSARLPVYLATGSSGLPAVLHRPIIHPRPQAQVLGHEHATEARAPEWRYTINSSLADTPARSSIPHNTVGDLNRPFSSNGRPDREVRSEANLEADLQADDIRR